MPRRDNGFLNVDLEIGARTRAQLVPLLDALQGKLAEIYRGRLRGLYRAHYETSGRTLSASATIRDLVTAIEKLPPSARRTWDRAAMRDFNIGVELGLGAHSVELAVDRDAIRRVAAVGGRVAFTAYSAESRDPSRAPRANTRRR